MKNQLTKVESNIVEALIIKGDLSGLKQEDKVTYYKQFCERLGLDPFTQPFKILKLSGKEVLYCDRSGTQQLNKLHKVSHTIKLRETISDCYVVTANASTPDGRFTESIGAVNIKGKTGDDLCNQMMKAETKAKRRATLDLLGLGLLDETETDSIPNAVTTQILKGEQDETEAPKITDGQIAHIDNLIHNSSITENAKVKIEREMYDYTQERAEKCISYLKENQLESLDEGFNRALKND
jgi:hypothetical protein